MNLSMNQWAAKELREDISSWLGRAVEPYCGKGKTSTYSAVVFCLSALVLVSCLGCGGNTNGRLALSGSVTLDGQPLQEGSISFLSVGAAKKSMTGGAIVEGGYSIPAKEGLVVGTYRVSISAADKSDATPAGLPANGQFFPSLIPPEFEKANHQVEVTVEGPNEFSFDIQNSK